MCARSLVPLTALVRYLFEKSWLVRNPLSARRLFLCELLLFKGMDHPAFVVSSYFGSGTFQTGNSVHCLEFRTVPALHRNY